MESLEPAEKRGCFAILIILALFPLMCVIFGILFISGSLHYLDCSRQTGQVDCEITTRFLGTFITGKRTASGVTQAIQGEKCDQDSCQFRLELSTPGGLVPVSKDYMGAEAETLAAINAFLADPGRQVFHTLVIAWVPLVLSGISVVLGAIGLLVCLAWFMKTRQAKTEWRDVIHPGEGKAHIHPEQMPIPENLTVHREINGLRFSYRHPGWKGFTWLVIGAIAIFISLLFLDSPEAPLETVIISIFGVIMVYIGLVTVVNHMIIQVSYNELVARYSPLPYMRTRRLLSSQIKQLYTLERDVHTRYGTRKVLKLNAVLHDNRRLSLAGELPYEVLHYLEVQIESWLGLKDRRVVEEAGVETPERVWSDTLERIATKVYENGFADLSYPVKVLFTVHEFERCMMKSGFELTFSSLGDFPLDPLVALEAVQATHTAEVFRSASRLVPEGVRTNKKALKDWLNSMDAETRNCLDQLYEEFSGKSDLLYEYQVDYCLANREHLGV